MATAASFYMDEDDLCDMCGDSGAGHDGICRQCAREAKRAELQTLKREADERD